MIHNIMLILFVIFVVFLLVGFNREMAKREEDRKQAKKDKNETTY